jgi:hypothetical protein
MIRNALIALTAAGAMGLAFAPAAEAKTKINVDLGFHVGGGGIYIGGPGYYDDGWYGDCGFIKVKHKKWNKWHTKKIVWYTKKYVCY